MRQKKVGVLTSFAVFLRDLQSKYLSKNIAFDRLRPRPKRGWHSYMYMRIVFRLMQQRRPLNKKIKKWWCASVVNMLHHGQYKGKLFFSQLNASLNNLRSCSRSWTTGCRCVVFWYNAMICSTSQLVVICSGKWAGSTSLASIGARSPIASCTFTILALGFALTILK